MSGRKSKISPKESVSLETYILLREWGRWARRDVGVRLALPSSTRFERDPSGGPKSLLINDETAAYVDQCVAGLSSACYRDAIVLRYVRGASTRAIGKELRIHYQAATSLLELAESELQERFW